jgi:hypothetical protein
MNKAESFAFTICLRNAFYANTHKQFLLSLHFFPHVAKHCNRACLPALLSRGVHFQPQITQRRFFVRLPLSISCSAHRLAFDAAKLLLRARCLPSRADAESKQAIDCLDIKNKVSQSTLVICQAL